MTEKELVQIMLQKDRLKEIALAIRHIDPDKNGFVTQQELDDIFRENYREEMEGKHIFDLIKDFRSMSNKILVDYGKFKKWIFTIYRDAKKERDNKNDPTKEILKSLLSKTANTAKKSVADDEKSRAELDGMKHRLN